MRILVVEDNEKLGGYIKKVLEQDGYAVDHVLDGEAGARMGTSPSYDCILLDVMLPLKSGVTVCKELREQDVTTPIIMITAKGELDEKIEGLDSGADDYLVKPFEMQELQARVRALLRRPEQRVGEVVSVADISLDTNTRTVKKGGEVLRLTPKEFSVLEYLMRNAGRAVSRDELLSHCWDFAYDPESNITDAYIKQLRKKLHDTDETYIKTVRGVGYTLAA
jgi:DNA-binding response OmpR family regulator